MCGGAEWRADARHDSGPQKSCSTMKTRMIKPIVVLSALTAFTSTQAQETSKPAAGTDAVIEAKDDVRMEAEAAKAEKPERPERPKIDREEAKDSIDEIKTNFRAKAQEYVKKQKEIINNPQ